MSITPVKILDFLREQVLVGGRWHVDRREEVDGGTFQAFLPLLVRLSWS